MAWTPAEIIFELMSHQRFKNYSGSIMTVGSFGLQIRFENPMPGRISIDFSWIDPIANRAEWHISRRDQEEPYLHLLEPLCDGRVEVGNRLFHATRLKNVDSILSGGIKLRTGGNTWMKRTYTPRSHHALTLWDAMTFVDILATERAAIDGPGALSQEELLNYEIFEFGQPDGAVFWVDPWMTGAVWTNKVIPAGSLKKVANWRVAYSTAAGWR